MDNINTLREILFETIRKVKSGEIDPAEAKTIVNASQAIVNSVKVEVDFIKAVGGIAVGSGFIPLEPLKPDMKKLESHAQNTD